MGTPDYAAPEQFTDAHSADARSDVYSLGCTLYHLLAGRVPFPGSSISEKYKAHCHTVPNPVVEHSPDVPGGVVLALERMMAKRPADRFPTMRDVADALMPFVSASPVSFDDLRTTWTWNAVKATSAILRRPSGLTWAVSGVLALVVLFGFLGFVSSWCFRAENDPRVADLGEKNPVEEKKPGDVVKKDDNPAAKDGKKPDDTPKVVGDSDVLTVSRTKEGGGKYKTINDALKVVKPGQTVRLLDDAVYQESIVLGEQHAGLTLEAVAGATIVTTKAEDVIVVEKAPDVTLRGLRMRANDVQNRERVSVLV
jgi:serine/threonine protein kinase